MSRKRNRALSAKARALYARVVAGLAPPETLDLAAWADANIVLPPGQSARPGRYQNWPYMVEIMRSIGADEVERVTVLKSTRIGYTKSLMAAIGAKAVVNPGRALLLVPTDDDATDLAVDEVEPIFESTPALKGVLRKGRANGRSTLTRKSMVGGANLLIIGAAAPRKLRKHGARDLYVDEADGIVVTKEGDALLITEKRTMAHADRKIVVGSTPTDEDTSVTLRRYLQSDQRVYEVPCPFCGAFFEILFPNIMWPEGRPDLAFCRCPHCEKPIDESYKGSMVYAGVWRATKPEVKGHHGYRINSFVSLLENASWGQLATEWMQAKRAGPSEMQVFVNTVEGRAWRTTLSAANADMLSTRVEKFGIGDGGDARIPVWVLLITGGADVQDDRVELTLLGWGFDAVPTVLGHVIFEGNTLEPEVWAKLDKFRRRRWMHPNGWQMGIDALAVDSGGREGRTQIVYDWTKPRLGANVYAIKGDDGEAKPFWKRAAKVKGGYPLFIVGSDVSKTTALDALAAEPFLESGARNPHAMRFAETLDYDWFEQATNEIRRVRYVRTRAVIEIVPKRQGARTEAFDCLRYGWAVRQSPAVKAISLVERAARRPDADQKPKSAADWATLFNGPGR
jgi:phage terminase large subunit GpA-like protein